MRRVANDSLDEDTGSPRKSDHRAASRLDSPSDARTEHRSVAPIASASIDQRAKLTTALCGMGFTRSDVQRALLQVLLEPSADRIAMQRMVREAISLLTAVQSGGAANLGGSWPSRRPSVVTPLIDVVNGAREATFEPLCTLRRCEAGVLRLDYPGQEVHAAVEVRRGRHRHEQRRQTFVRRQVVEDVPQLLNDAPSEWVRRLDRELHPPRAVLVGPRTDRPSSGRKLDSWQFFRYASSSSKT
jgi:hypothetical protein